MIERSAPTTTIRPDVHTRFLALLARAAERERERLARLKPTAAERRRLRQPLRIGFIEWPDRGGDA